MSANDDLPQSVCPFCLHQIKTTYYFTLKCQESDRKLRLSLSSAAEKCNDIANANDEFTENEVPAFECIEGEDSNMKCDTEECELNRG